MESYSRSWNAHTCPLDRCQRCLIASDHGNIPLIEKGAVTDFGPCVEISDPREQVTDSRMNHRHAKAVQRANTWRSEMSDPVHRCRPGLGDAERFQCTSGSNLSRSLNPKTYLEKSCISPLGKVRK